jgi:hypothetical protein
MRLLLTSALLLNISCAALAVTPQQTPPSDPQCNEEVVSDKSHPVWRAIDSALRQKEQITLNGIEVIVKGYFGNVT